MKNDKHLRLTVIGDFHYAKAGYITTVDDLRTILASAVATESDLVLHCGDFANGYSDAPELVREYCNPTYPIPRLGVYGNHELEGPNGMREVTPLLTCGADVVWGTASGKPLSDGSVGYYYYDIGAFRIIALDSNYSWNPKEFIWEHNKYWSYGQPQGNESVNALSPAQLDWFETVLTDAADRGLHCIALSHNNCFGTWWSCPDSEEFSAIVRRVNERKPLTLIAYISGHVHTDRHRIHNNIVEFDVAATRNCEWIPQGSDHYNESHTYRYTEYDKEGNALRTYDRPLCELGMARQTWFSEKTLFATVDIDMETGRIEILGTEGDWIYGIAPEPRGAIHPYITSGSYQLEL